MAKSVEVPFAGREGQCLICSHSGGLFTEFAELSGTVVRFYAHNWCKRENLAKNRGLLSDDIFPPDFRASIKKPTLTKESF